MFMRPKVVLSLVCLAIGLGQPKARAQDKPDLPTADTVLNQYIEATGGKAAYEKLKNRVSTGSIELPAANIKGTIKLTQAAPNNTFLFFELGPAGETRRGTDGKTAWEISTLTGERDLDGEEKESFIRESSFYKELLWKELYDKVECVGVEDVNGKPAYKLVLTPKSGKPVTEYYDKTTHLIVKQTATSVTPNGEITVDSYPSDFKMVDAIMVPFTSTQKVLTQEIVMKLTEIKHNVDLPADAFKRPGKAPEPAKAKQN
jgi:zinc protease